MKCIKQLAESPGLTSIPSNYAFTTNPDDQAVSEEPEDLLPVIDFSLLTSGTPHQRSKIIQELGQACKDWGFFMLINHGIPESLMEAVIEGIRGFFDLTEEEKREFEQTNVLNPIRYGTSFNRSMEKVSFWRDFLKAFVHPEFNFPNKPAGFRFTESVDQEETKWKQMERQNVATWKRKRANRDGEREICYLSWRRRGGSSQPTMGATTARGGSLVA
uniref:Non-haem dioxygenase N-terminal domain-containing protein n=1 Tax=Fagus sylvatica TaxID=28930 RepID=A0A2N9J4K5_FAGSY